MSATHVAVLLIFLSMPIKLSICFNIHNNACRNYNDYPMRFWSKHCYYNPNVLADTPTMIRMNDYPLEAYTINTKDGYILTIFRIPARNNKRNKQPVFLMHGIFCSPEIWVHSGNKSLAFFLSDKGYDVWLGTVRGTSFAKFHKHYNMSSKNYWKYNLDSLAYFDVGEQLRFIANKTRKWGSVIYLGHSMGTTLSFMYASGYPTEANSLLSGIIALAPVVYLRDLKLVTAIMAIAPALELALSRLHVEGLFYENSTNSSNNKLIVGICAIVPYMCQKVLEIFAGHLTNQFRPDELLLFFSHCPAPASFQLLKHYKQIVESGRLQRYDYGRLKNKKYYHIYEPVPYNLSNIRVPVYLFYGNNDALVSEKSVEMLYRKLGSRKKRMQHIPKNSEEPPFNHLDFFMAKDIKQYLYAELFHVMQEQIRGN